MDVLGQRGGVDPAQRHLVLHLHVGEEQTRHVVMATGPPGVVPGAGGGGGGGGGLL